MLETFPRIIVKHSLRVSLTAILESVSNFSSTWMINFSSIKNVKVFYKIIAKWTQIVLNERFDTNLVREYEDKWEWK